MYSAFKVAEYVKCRTRIGRVRHFFIYLMREFNPYNVQTYLKLLMHLFQLYKLTDVLL
jgi:hypothetical protein